MHPAPVREPQWQQGATLEVEISDLAGDGGVARWQGRVVFIPDTVTGDRALVRLVHVKPRYARAKLVELLSRSPHRIRPRCIVADKCGGCQWQHVADEYQRQSKQKQLVAALERIGGFDNPPIEPLVLADSPLHYRNKATYPLDRSATGRVRAGYYRSSSHQLVNLNQCPVQDPRLDPLLAQIKQDIEQRGWEIYDEKSHRGQLRHLSLRIGRRTGEIVLTLVTTAKPPQIEAQAQTWLQRYPNLVGVALNFNSQRTNAIFGSHTELVAGQLELVEEFAGVRLHLRPDTFFQVNTEVAEALFYKISDRLQLTGEEVFVDAYCGVGTFTLPFACQVKSAIGIERQADAVELARANARLNQINNVTFLSGSVETLLSQLQIAPDLVLLDPPRKGCDRQAIDTLMQIRPRHLVYVSCNSATLARDLQKLCRGNDNYQLIWGQAADFFPQTAHVEAAVVLSHRSCMETR